MLSLSEARARILELAEPAAVIEVPLTEALGLTLAEPAVGDVDLPPFDRAAIDGYALRAADGKAGTWLRVVGRHPGPGGEVEVGAEEAALVAAGDPMPIGADAVARTEETRPESGVGPPPTIQVVKAIEGPGQNVVKRGFYLAAGTQLAPAGTRVRLPLVGLLAAQGCVHPSCHRRVRVAVLAVGDHLISPSEAPVLHRERNAAAPAIVAPSLLRGATAHDLGAVPEDQIDAALSRALAAPIAVVLGPLDGVVLRAFAHGGIEPVFSGVSLHPGKHLNYGVTRNEEGTVQSHVFHLPANPIGALNIATLLIGPLIARLQGGPAGALDLLKAVWSGPHRATDDRLWVVPVRLTIDDDARLHALPIDYRGKDDLPGFARAEALALLPARSGPWHGGEIVEVAPLGALDLERFTHGWRTVP